MKKRWPAGVAVFIDGPGPYADYYQATGVEQGHLELQRFANEHGPLTWVDNPHIFVDGGTWDGLHHLKPVTPYAHAMLAIAKVRR